MTNYDSDAPRRDPETGEVSQPGLDLRIASETKRIFGQHSQLRLFFEMVRESLQRGSLQSARIAFTRFRDALEAHIDVEDHQFFPALRGLKPHLAASLAQLVRDHARYRQILDELHEMLARGSAEEFNAGFGKLCDDFAQHEAREESLTGIAVPTDDPPAAARHE